VSGTAPFDRWVAGDEQAIDQSAKRGFDVFTGKGRCRAAGC
jgi:cytochrome c peroxidase